MRRAVTKDALRPTAAFLALMAKRGNGCLKTFRERSRDRHLARTEQCANEGLLSSKFGLSTRVHRPRGAVRWRAVSTGAQCGRILLSGP
jgi:hypothetical protein